MPASKWFSIEQLITAVVGGLIVAIVVGRFNYWIQIPLLRSQVNDLRASQSILINAT